MGRFATACSLAVVVACSRAEPPPTSWVVVHADASAPATVAREAEAAHRRGLVPVLYLSAPYTMAGANLDHHHDGPEMTEALAGVAVIAIDDPTALPAFESAMRGTWSSFHELDAGGRPTGRSLDPGTKDGPCSDPAMHACAAWLRPWTRTLTSR